MVIFFSPMSDQSKNRSTLRLFDSANPLEERLGKPFFEALPTEPGVYRMYGRAGRLLYVGKAKNLRNRLFTYRRVNHGNSSRKTRRLVRMTHKIDIELCESEEAALLKENALIREHRPEFNRAKKSPETYYFITLRPAGDACYFRLAMQRPAKEDELAHTYGAFKGHRTVRKGTGALLRQLYLLEHAVQTPFDFPSVLTGKLTPMQYNLPYGEEWPGRDTLHAALPDLLSGRSLQFLEGLVGAVTDRSLMDAYVGRLILKDCESIRRLYDHCLRRNYELKQALGLSERLIPQQKLDDYLVQAAFRE